MSRPAKSTKRERERAKQAKQKEKEARRAQRKEAKANQPRPEDGTDPDLAGMTPGPQEPLY
jgi:hypothetical protein